MKRPSIQCLLMFVISKACAAPSTSWREQPRPLPVPLILFQVNRVLIHVITMSSTLGSDMDGHAREVELQPQVELEGQVELAKSSSVLILWWTVAKFVLILHPKCTYMNFSLTGARTVHCREVRAREVEVANHRSELALQIVFSATATKHGCSLLPTRIHRGLRIQ